MLQPDILDQLKAIVGEKWCLHTTADLMAYSYDATPGHQRLPDAVLLPETTSQVSEIMKLANQHKIPVWPRGSATNLSAGTVPGRPEGIVVSLTRMTKILEIDEENLTATVQPGVITAKLMQAVEAKGLFYPPDPSSMQISTIGGNVALGSGGLRGLKYGVTKDYVMGLEVVLVDGRIMRLGGKNVKDVAGYDLLHLFVGSEGTLGLITEVTVKLVPRPPARRTMLALFHDLEGSARSVSRIIANHIIPVTLEFMDNTTIRVVEDFAKIGLPTEAGALLLIQQDGDEAACIRDIEAIEAICREEGAFDTKLAQNAEEELALMEARRTALTAISRLRPTTMLEDATVPRSKLAEMVKATNEIAKRHNVQIATFGHAGDGNLHPTCTYDERDPEETARVEAAFAEIFDAALRLGGTITGEHGVGEAKAGYLEWRVGEVGIEVMRAVKQAFDPEHLLNPGKMFANETRKRVVVRQ